MASEEPPCRRDDPPDTKTRLISAPPAADPAAKAPVVNMSTATNGVSAPQAATQNSGSDHGANEDLSAAAGQNDKQASETASAGAEDDTASTTVKAEPESEASVPQNVPSIASDEPSTEQRDGSPKVEDATATASDSESQQKLKPITLDNIQKLGEETDLAKLEAGVDEALAVLDTLRAPLSDSKQINKRDWLATINKLQQQSNRTRTVVAVVGETGAGKTSLINALLDEDKLLVTSGWRACTAVICEISYNEMDDPRKAYRAEVEFVSQQDWDHELNVLLADATEDNHLSPAKSDSKTEAGIAYAKIKAVYPDLTDSMIAQHTVRSLAKRTRVAEVLGTTRRIDCENASDLCSAVQKYMDSKEKNTKLTAKKEADMAFWPLIKVVRIFCRAEVLSTGLVIVDLPGVADSNPARSAIASKYMTERSAVWVAAPIKRATDNKVAKDLMGKSSRLQMKLDGIYSSVTFICTMTDAIDITEAVEAFDDDGKIRATNSREDEVQNMIKGKEDALERLAAEMRDRDLGLISLEEELAVWKDIRKKHQRGHEVFPPQIPSKRKRTAGSRRPRTSRRKVADEDSEGEEAPEAPPLTANDISAKLDDLQNLISPAENEYADMHRRHEALGQELVNLNQEKNDAAIEGDRLCVLRRNEVVKKAIQHDFASGIRELDEDEAQDDESFDPSAVQSRDYEQVADSLPVFTISAKAFQQIRRPKKREAQVAGFSTLLDTDIPQLVAHAMKLPEKGRIVARQNFLNEVCRLLGSLTIWCTAGDVSLGENQISAKEQTYHLQHLQNELINLRKKLDLAIIAQKKELENIVHIEVDQKSAAAVRYAAKVIPGIVAKWAMKEQDGGKGLRFATYRSTCRQEGKRTKAEKSFDFNEAILEPYLQKIANSWEQAFSRSIPCSLDNFSTTFTKILGDFHSMMAAREELQKCRMASMRMFSKQLDNHSKSIETTIQSMKADIQNEQRNANKAFVPEIVEEMAKVYERCTNEKGTGCFVRIKDHMMQHVNKQKSAMYRKASRRVLKELHNIFEANSKELTDSVHAIVEELQKDFEMILSNSEMIEASEVARDHIRGVLQGVDARFGSILAGEPMEVDSAQPQACEPQQLPNVSMADVEPASGEATEAAPSGEDVAMDTAL